MIRGTANDKATVIDILSESFESNKSVSYVVKQDNKKDQRVRALMAYSFDRCLEFGHVWLNESKSGCALILDPAKEKLTIRSIMRDLRLAFEVIGPLRVKNVLVREGKVKSRHPKQRFLYLWYIGVKNTQQKQGQGSMLLKEIHEWCNKMNKDLYLETSTSENIPFYKKFGYEIYDQIDIAYKLYFMRKCLAK